MSLSFAQKFTRTFGAVYILVGVIGFIGELGGSSNMTGNALLGIFGVNLLHNVVHLAVGALFLLGSTSPDNALKTATGIGVVYLLVGVVGLLGIDVINDLLFINTADNILHLATGALSLAVGTGKLALA
ncbi:MAG: DUF4383 domain-containing protein [Actinomycetota bacterium]